MVTESLQDYSRHHLATFDLHYCQNDTTNYFGKISYFQNGDEIKKDTILNSCQKK